MAGVIGKPDITDTIRDHEKRVRSLETMNRERTASSGGGGGGSGSWYYDEFQVTVDGDGQVFALSFEPLANAATVTLNGLVATPYGDYEIAGTSLTMTAYINASDVVTVRYQA